MKNIDDEDDDGDGILDANEDTDEDGIKNLDDKDDDNDGVMDGAEDDDGDGVNNDEDFDDNNDGYLDADVDQDLDGVEDEKDLDDDDKVLIVKELIKHEYPEIRSFIPKKPEISCDMEIDRNTKLRPFIGKKSCFFRYL